MKKIRSQSTILLICLTARGASGLLGLTSFTSSAQSSISSSSQSQRPLTPLMTPQEEVSLEEKLLQNAVTLPTSYTKEEAAEQLLSNGVCRISGLLRPDDCDVLGDYVNQMLQVTTSSSSPISRPKLPSRIPDTRLNCESEPVLLPLHPRTVMLLPLQNNLVQAALQYLISRLGPIFEHVVPQLLPPSKNPHNSNVQLLEAACEVFAPAGVHQQLHASFSRDPSCSSPVPPRIAAFVYLQDTPNKQHGPTVFVPRSNTKEAHQHFKTQTFPAQDAVAAILNKGDVVLYDASLLHFNSANRNGHDRGVLYFSAGYGGQRQVTECHAIDGTTLLTPVELNIQPDMTGDPDRACYSWSHERLFRTS